MKFYLWKRADSTTEDGAVPPEIKASVAEIVALANRVPSTDPEDDPEDAGSASSGSAESATTHGSTATDTHASKAQWSAGYVSDLPDSAFALVRAGGKKDAEGKTEPRSLRFLPYKDATGAVDLDHLRNALARLPQASTLSDAEKAKATAVLSAAAEAAGVGNDSKNEGGSPEMSDELKKALAAIADGQADEAVAKLSDAEKQRLMELAGKANAKKSDGLSPEVRAELEKRDKEITTAKAETAALKLTVRKRDMLAKVDAEYGHFPLKKEDAVDVLLAVEDALPAEAFAKLDLAIRSASTLIKESEHLKARGAERSGAGAGGDVLTKAEAGAAEIMKADPKLKKEQALAKYWDTHKDEYTRYLAESRQPVAVR